MKRNSGFTLLEVIGALIASSLLMLVLFALWQRGQTSVEQAHAAYHLREVNNATEIYVKRHYETLLHASSASSGPRITIAQLINDGALPEDFRDTNLWGQSYEIYVRRPQENVLNTIIITRGGREHEEGDPSLR